MSDGLFPDDLAEACKENAGRPYRPSNGTEGELFREWFCDRCARDVNNDCPIYVQTLIHDEDDPEYPKEWIIGEDGQPKCTAFAALSNDTEGDAK